MERSREKKEGKRDSERREINDVEDRVTQSQMLLPWNLFELTKKPGSVEKRQNIIQLVGTTSLHRLPTIRFRLH